MSTIPLHQVFLDNIFDRLEEASNIIIDFAVCKPADQTQTTDDFQVTSVNGFTSDSEFSDYVHLLVEEVVQKDVEKVPGLSNGLAVPLVTEAHKRLDRLKQIVRRERYLVNDTGHPDVWVFANPVFQCPDLHGLPSWVKHQVVHRVNCFAWVWRNMIRSFLDDLKFIARQRGKSLPLFQKW